MVRQYVCNYITSSSPLCHIGLNNTIIYNNNIESYWITWHALSYDIHSVTYILYIYIYIISYINIIQINTHSICNIQFTVWHCNIQCICKYNIITYYIYHIYIYILVCFVYVYIYKLHDNFGSGLSNITDQWSAYNELPLIQTFSRERIMARVCTVRMKEFAEDGSGLRLTLPKIGTHLRHQPFLRDRMGIKPITIGFNGGHFPPNSTRLWDLPPVNGQFFIGKSMISHTILDQPYYFLG